VGYKDTACLIAHNSVIHRDLRRQDNTVGRLQRSGDARWGCLNRPDGEYTHSAGTCPSSSPSASRTDQGSPQVDVLSPAVHKTHCSMRRADSFYFKEIATIRIDIYAAYSFHRSNLAAAMTIRVWVSLSGSNPTNKLNASYLSNIAHFGKFFTLQPLK